MKQPAAILLAATMACHGWTMRDGRVFDAELVAADGLRATFNRGEKTPVVVPLLLLTDDDARTIRGWREDRRHPLVLPQRLAKWPKQAAAPVREARFTGEEDGVFLYQSPHFVIESDLKLPASAVNDIATVLEATRAVLIAIPLGFHGGGESDRYRVHLFRDRAGYAAAGGINGSGGHYDGRTRRMLVLLPNLGIEEKDGVLRLDHRRSLFILKHEVVHQLMAPWHRRLPLWVSEGIAEFIASLPYASGTYTLQPPGSGMRDYLLKWQPSKNERSLRLIPPHDLMAMDLHDWNAAVKRERAYDLYNSAALVTWHFIQQENGAPLAAYLDALRRGAKPAAARETHLLKGIDPGELTKQVAATARRLGIEPVDETGEPL